MHFPSSPKFKVAVADPFNAHLVLNAAAVDVVEHTLGAVIINTVFGDDENGNALRSGRIAFDARQNRMNNVRGEIVIARGDEALGSGDQVFSIGHTFCRCSQSANVSACAWLGEAHGACKFTGEADACIFPSELPCHSYG